MFEQENYGNKRYHDEPLFSEKIFAERKVFFVDLKSNDRGKFLKITEDVRGRRDTIMLPTDNLRDMITALQNVADHLGDELDEGHDDDDFEDDDEDGEEEDDS